MFQGSKHGPKKKNWGAWTTGYSPKKKKKKNGEYKSSPYTFPKNLFKMDHKPKSKTQNYDF